MKKNNFRKVIVFFMAFLICFTAFSFENIPYQLNAQFVIDENSTDYQNCGVNIDFCNSSEKSVKNFEVVFYLFDRDGEPAVEYWDEISFIIENEVGLGELFSTCLSLDSYINEVPEYLLMVDYLFIRKIEYVDGSVWEDPYGLLAFM
ncbi:MAG: hypothetical protein J6X84_03740 [Treponema sp.]|nr:hypothetical protein [Treponema sp.]